MGLEASEVPFVWVVRMNRIKENDQFLPEVFEERMAGKGLIIKDILGTSSNKIWTPWLKPEIVSVTKERIDDVVTQLMGNVLEAEAMRSSKADWQKVDLPTMT
ncbi:hypothetical protein IFM89_005815 [Coptis chinensis]|uniref:Uncharacterized protein n=1 Tax=Coptis chinensis TaxID=261450 RepID=A0A835IJW2_9MAGN|nr:hypothetical protein IFM89_005815 [Coptis chinensis]